MQAHEAATRYLMREAVRRNLDPAPLWEESRYCRELIRAWYDRVVWDRESTGPAFRPNLCYWPDVLAEQCYELPIVLQQAITNGECFFAHLIAVFEIDIAKADTLLAIPPAAENWQFSPGQATYNGTEIRVVGICRKLLECLVKSNSPVTEAELIEAGWGHDADKEPKTLQNQLTSLRKRLRKELSLSDDQDPIPVVDSGASRAWKLGDFLR